MEKKDNRLTVLEQEEVKEYIKNNLWENFYVTFENSFCRVYFSYMENHFWTAEKYFLIQCPERTFYKNMEWICKGISKETYYKKYLFG